LLKPYQADLCTKIPRYSNHYTYEGIENAWLVWTTPSMIRCIVADTPSSKEVDLLWTVVVQQRSELIASFEGCVGSACVHNKLLCQFQPQFPTQWQRITVLRKLWRCNQHNCVF